MNRIIKFRAWDKKEKKIYAVYQMSLFDGGELNSGAIKLAKKITNYSKNEWQPLGDVEVMQFTGLKDKNGKEIYEGDILRFKDGYEENKKGNFVETIQEVLVVFGGGEFYGQTKKGDRWNNGYSYEDFDDDVPFFKSKVIGNIYENPELLK